MIFCIEGPSQGLFTSIHIVLVVDPGEAPQLNDFPESAFDIICRSFSCCHFVRMDIK